MNRAKIRKAIAALPFHMPETQLNKAMSLVRNEKTRQHIKAAYQRRQAAATR